MFVFNKANQCYFFLQLRMLNLISKQLNFYSIKSFTVNANDISE